MAGWLWAGPEAAVSHRSAAALWKLDGIDAGNVIELTTTGSRNHVPNGLTLHRTRLLTPSDTGWLGALKVTGLVRTLVDLGAVVQDTALVEAAMESVLRRDQQLFDRMKERLETLGYAPSTAARHMQLVGRLSLLRQQQRLPANELGDGVWRSS